MKAEKPAGQIKRFVRLFGGHAPKNTPVFFFRHTFNKYGQFNIGLNKRWGIKIGVTPVFYMHEQSQMFKPLSDRLWAARRQKDATATNDLMLLTAYTKPFLGNAWRNGKTQSDVHFYDEREWRY